MSPLNMLMHALTLALLTQTSHAQDSRQCPLLESELAYNASGTTSIPALTLSYLGDTDENDIRISENPEFRWQLTSIVQPSVNQEGSEWASNSTHTALWLDTGDSNQTRLGEQMRMCHNYVPLQERQNVTWGYEALRKSVDDTGDCRALVSDACLQRLQVQYGLQAQQQRGNRYNGCEGTNNTVPWECAESGMVEPVSLPNPEFNATLPNRFAYLQDPENALTTSDALVCNGHNMSRSTGTLASTQFYDLGVNFPIMDIMTFFGTANSGSTFRADSYRVQISCLVPGPVTEGSREKESVETVLARYNSTGGDETAGAQALGCGLAMWVVVAWALGLGFVFTV